MNDRELITQLVEALEVLGNEVGWRGRGPNDQNEYYCELCGAHHENLSKTEHGRDCSVRLAETAAKAGRARLQQLEGEVSK